MSTPKEIFLELIRPDGQPERQLRQYEALHMCLTDPCNTYLRGNRKRGTTSRDRWGTTILFPEDAPGPMPDTREGLAVCPDITRWRETVHAPDLEAACTEGWEACRAEARAACGPDHLLAGFMGTGIFEQCHFLMGFEDTLTNLYAHPDEMHALIDYITEYRLTYVRMLIDNLQPDVIFSHDDWGTKNALFMKPEMWREFFKEPYRRFYGYIRSRGVIAIHHADSYLVPIVDDMAEIGIQVWQGVLPENDIPALQRHLNGRLTLMGGFGAAIDRKDAAPEEILTYARDVLRRDCPGGHFIPSITYGLAGTVYPHAIKKAGKRVFEDAKAIRDNEAELRETRKEVDRISSDELMNAVKDLFTAYVTQAQTLLEEQSRAYWENRTSCFKDAMAKIVTQSSALNEKERSELAGIIIQYQALAFENHAESIFEKAAFVYKFFGDTNRINIDKLTKRFNSELRLMVQQIYNSFESSHANSFDEWMNNLLDTVIENIVEFSPQLYNQAEIIREETERIAELESRKLKLREYSEQIRRMMDWKEC